MISWKRFMGWGIGSTQHFKGSVAFHKSRQDTAPQFRALAWRLLLSYVVAMGAVVGILIIAIYQFVTYSLYQRIDQGLMTLATAAAHNLPEILANRAEIQNRMPRILDGDGDLDIPWQDLRQGHQSIQWFDAKRQLLGQSGTNFPSHPPGIRFQTWYQDGFRTLTIPVYGPDTDKPKRAQGYVRVSESIVEEEEELNRLLAAMTWGGLIAVILIGGSGWWLTRRSLQPIEQSFRQLKQFTADASHELRSPLTAIRTAVDVMQSHPERIHPADVKKLELIGGATHQMSDLLEGLLLLARTDASIDGAFAAKTGIVIPLEELLEDLVTCFHPQAATKGIALTIAEFPPVQVKGDATQLRRLFVNLLENALHYTPSGGTVRVSIAPIETSHDSVVIQIEDTGIGIAPEHLAHVFDRFWRTDQARNRREGGSGLGLAIAQAIAQAHGGMITVTSRLGAGSRFQVELPLA